MFSIYNHNGQWFLRVGWLTKPVNSYQQAVGLVGVFALASAHSNTSEVN